MSHLTILPQKHDVLTNNKLRKGDNHMLDLWFLGEVGPPRQDCKLMWWIGCRDKAYTYFTETHIQAHTQTHARGQKPNIALLWLMMAPGWKLQHWWSRRRMTHYLSQWLVSSLTFTKANLNMRQDFELGISRTAVSSVELMNAHLKIHC